MHFRLFFILMLSFLAALLLIVVVISAFSEKSSKESWKNSVVITLLGCFACLGILFLLGLLNANSWPPQWLERGAQRRQILERLQPVGGWAALKKECDALATKYQYDPYGFRWLYGFTNSLPPVIAALKPKEVVFYSKKALDQFGDQSRSVFGSNIVVRISIFGAHSTGGHDQPWLGLDVVCEPGCTSYSPERLRSTAPLRYWHYRKVTDDIYEFY